MRFDDLQKNWEDFGNTNPLWAVHTGGDNWDEDAFFKTGQEEIDKLIEMLESVDADPPHGRALDFGSGVGRLSLALARWFDRVDGVDISQPMVKGAEAYRASREDIDDSKVNFHVNTELDLSLFDDQTFDLVLSFIVLQHMKPEFSATYIAEFCRVVDRGGTVAFQIPARRSSLFLRVRGTLARRARQLRQAMRGGEGVMEMYGTPRAKVESILRDNGLRIVSVTPDDRAATWESYTYVARRD